MNSAIALEIKQIINFINDIDQLKKVNRKIKVRGTDRFENSAEHSWQVAMLAMSLIPYAANKIEPLRVIKMLLLHDVVEIDTGDKFAYSTDHVDTENETKAAQRIFALLPTPIGQEFMALWLEYEDKSSDDAIFAYSIDRVTPIILNLANNGQSWREHKITLQQVIDKNNIVAKSCPALWDYIYLQLQQAQQSGLLL